MRPNIPTSHALANHSDRDPVALIPGDCERCGEDRPIRVWQGVRQCGGCGWVQQESTATRK